MEAYGSPPMAPQMMPPHYMPPPYMSPGMTGIPGGYAGIYPQHFYGPPHSGDAIATGNPFSSAYPHYPMFVHVSPREPHLSTQNIYEAPQQAPTEEPTELVRPEDSFT